MRSPPLLTQPSSPSPPKLRISESNRIDPPVLLGNPPEMISDSELVERLHGFLRTSDLHTTTTATLRRQLEEYFGVDLSGKKAFIREQVDLFLRSEFEKAEEEDEQNEEEQRFEVKDEKAKVKSEASEGSGSKEANDEEFEEEVEDDDVQEGSTPTEKGSKKSNEEVKKRGGGFTKLCSLSPQLQEFIGESEMARTGVVKQLWCYIRENNLQDPSNRRNIICDEKLRPLFKVDTINMFQMNKALAKHIWPLEDEDAPTKSLAKGKRHKQEREDPEDESKQKEKRHKGGNSGLLAPLPLSDALVKFLGTGESALSRPDVVKRMWEYIKQNNLQDPSDKRRVLCDEKLKELFDLDTFNGFTVSKLLSSHFIKT